MEKTYYVYLLTNWNNQVMYVGVTNYLERRIYEHKNKLVDGFTKKYNVEKLVYFETASDVLAAIEILTRSRDLDEDAIAGHRNDKACRVHVYMHFQA